MVEVTEPSEAILLYGGVLVADEPSTNDRESPRYSYIFSNPCVNTKGMCNTKGGLSGRYNLKNQRIALGKYTGAYTISCPDGTRRIYHPAASDNFSAYRALHKAPKVLEGSYYHYILAEESLPNGNVILYEWPKKHENTWLIKSCDPTKKIIYAWAKFQMTRGEKMPGGGTRSYRDYDVTTSDGRHFKYFYKEGLSKAYLNKVTSAEKLQENFEYFYGQ